MVETRIRLYHVSGVHLGALGSESAVELVPMDARKASDGASRTLFIPLHFLSEMRDAKLLTITKP